METYSLLRHIADSWVLLVLFCVFVGVALWSFWPGMNKAREEARNIPFRDDEDDAGDAPRKEAENG